MPTKKGKTTKVLKRKKSVKSSSNVQHRARPDGRITSGKPTGKPPKD